jgi:IMP dehydrogenase
MGSIGAANLRDLHRAELVIAPAIKTEGKIFQAAQRIGMGKIR